MQQSLRTETNNLDVTSLSPPYSYEQLALWHLKNPYNLKPNPLAIWGFIIRKTLGSDKYCAYISYKDYKHDISLSKTTIRKILKELEKKGLITIERTTNSEIGWNGPNLYTLLFPSVGRKKPTLRLVESSQSVKRNAEIWKPVVGYEGRYEISSYGNVASLCYKGTSTRRLLKVNNRPNRFPCVYLYKGDKKKYVALCYIVATAFIENPHNHLEVECIDGNKRNNHVSNLRWVTGKENSNFLSESSVDNDNDDILFSIWERANKAGDYRFSFASFRKTCNDSNHPKHTKICSLVLKFLKLGHKQLAKKYNPNNLREIYKRAKEAGDYLWGYSAFCGTYNNPCHKYHKQVLSLVLKFAV